MSIKFLCIVLMMGSLLQGEQYMFSGTAEQRKMGDEAQSLVNADKIENGHQNFGSRLPVGGAAPIGWQTKRFTSYPGSI